MTFDEYQSQAHTTAVYNPALMPAWAYLLLGLTSESGEVADKFKKIVRNKAGVFTDVDKSEIKKELGDVLWYLSQLALELGFSFDEVAKANLKKVLDR